MAPRHRDKRSTGRQASGQGACHAATMSRRHTGKKENRASKHPPSSLPFAQAAPGCTPAGRADAAGTFPDTADTTDCLWL